jgi:hypothetical protein
VVDPSGAYVSRAFRSVDVALQSPSAILAIGDPLESLGDKRDHSTHTRVFWFWAGMISCRDLPYLLLPQNTKTCRCRSSREGVQRWKRSH